MLCDFAENAKRRNKELFEQGIKQGIALVTEQGIKQGIELGIKQGIELGIMQNRLEIAKALLLEKMPSELIIEITKLTNEQLLGIELN